MNTRLIRRTILILIGTAALLVGGKAQKPASSAQKQSPVAPQPKIKSRKELEAIKAIMNAPDPNSRIKAVDDLITNFADTEFKAFALQVATVSAQQLNDYEKVMLYGERTLKVDPNNYTVMLAMALALSQKTREFDLDKQEKLNRATELANKALAVLKTAPRPNPQVTEKLWEAAKGDYRAQAHEALGMVAMDRKNYDTAVVEFKAAVDAESSSNPATKLRLAAAYNQQGNNDEAIATLDTILKNPKLHPTIRKIAERERVRAVQLKKLKKLKESKAKK